MKRRNLLLGAVGTAAAAAGTSRTPPAEAAAVDPGTAVKPILDAVSLAVVNVKHPRFGAKGDGTADDTAAIQAAVNSLDRGAGQVYLPSGIYRVSSQITLAQSRVHLVGAGRHATQILFAPTKSGTCIKIAASNGSVLAECSVRNLQIYSHDSTLTKTALEIIECSQLVIEDVGINGAVVMTDTLMWAGGDSIGLKLDGHDAITVNRLYVAANRPIVIGPHWTDHLCFHDLYYIGDTRNAGIEVLDGTAQFSNITFAGYQAWVRPGTGFKYVDTRAKSVNAFNLRFENVRHEQETDTTSWMFDIQHNHLIYNVSFQNCRGGLNQNGWRVRAVRDVSWRDCLYHSPRLVAADVAGAPGHSLTFDNFTCFGGASVRLPGFRFQRGSWNPSAKQPVPQHATYVFDDPANPVGGWPLIGQGKEYVFTGTVTTQGSVDLQCGTASGVTIAQCAVSAHGPTTNEGGMAFVTPSGNFRMAGTPNFDVGNVSGKLTILKNGANTVMLNRLAETVAYAVRVTCF